MGVSWLGSVYRVRADEGGTNTVTGEAIAMQTKKSVLAEAAAKVIEGALASGDTGHTFLISRNELADLCEAYERETGEVVGFSREGSER